MLHIKGGAVTEQNDWVVINYTLPREPSRMRVAIWRRLKKIGAVNIQQSMWVLPQNDENYDLLVQIRNTVSQNGGEAFVMKSCVDEIGKKTLVERFNAARDEEYGEVLEQCGDFFKEIDKETARKNFTFAEVEENEEELNKLKKWYEKVAARDFFGSPLSGRVKTVLSECAAKLEEFCSRVYDFNDNGA